MVRIKRVMTKRANKRAFEKRHPFNNNNPIIHMKPKRKK